MSQPITFEDIVLEKRPDGTFIFEDYPDFRPNVTPKQMWDLGVYNGWKYSLQIRESIKLLDIPWNKYLEESKTHWLPETHNHYNVRSEPSASSSVMKELLPLFYPETNTCPPNYKADRSCNVRNWQELVFTTKQEYEKELFELRMRNMQCKLGVEDEPIPEAVYQAHSKIPSLRQQLLELGIYVG